MQNFNGDVTDIIPISVTDDLGATSAVNNLDIVITDSKPVAVNDANSITEDAAPNTVSGTVLSNDTVGADTNATPVTAATVSLLYGNLVLSNNGTYTYTLDNANPAVNALNNTQTLTDSYTYTLTDGDGSTTTAVLSITINGTNDAPVAVADTATVVESGVNPGNTAFPGTASATGNVLTNDTDVDTGDSKTVSAVNGVAGNVGAVISGTYGTVTIATNGSYTYTLNNALATTQALAQGATANEVFAYTMRDANGATSTANLTVTVTGTNDAPVAVADTATVVESGVNPGNTAFPGTASATGNVLTNDTDVDTGDSKTVSAVNGVAGNVGAVISGTYGTVTIATNGSYTYTLNNALATTQALAQGATANEVFAYTMRDANGATSTANLTVTVTGTNDTPILATSSTLAYTENGLASAINTVITLSDVDNTTLSTSTVVITGNFVTGQDVLSFTNAPATMGNIAGSYNALTGTMSLSSAGNTATLAQWQAALHAVLYSNSSDNPSTLARTVSYTVNDSSANSNTVTSTINVTAVNDAPVGNTDNYTAVEGTTTSKTTVLANDTDAEGSPLSVSLFASNTSGSGALAANGTNTITTALGGTVVMNANGTYTYTAPARNHGDVISDVDSFAYRANDGTINSAWTTVNITITDTDPTANNDVDSVGFGSSVTGNVITGAGGVTADTLNVDTPHSLTNVTLTQGTQVSNTLGAGNVRTIVTNRGTLSIDQDDGSYSYTLATPAAISVASPTSVASFTGAGFLVYGFDGTDGYVTIGNPNSGLNLSTLNSTSAGRVSFSTGGIGSDDVLTPSANQSRIEEGEELVIRLPSATKSATIAVSDLGNGEAAQWETYNASGVLISSGSWPGNGVQSFTISTAVPFNYVVVRSVAASSDEFRVTGISIQPEPSSTPDIFTYTLADSDGDISTATLTMNYDATTTASNDVATVFESGINESGAQNGGTQEAQTIERATGNILGNDTGVSSVSNLSISGGAVTGGTVTASAPDGNGVVTVTVTDTTSGSRTIATITVYTQNFGANVKGDYVVDLVGRTTDGTGTNDSFTMNYTLTNSVSGEVDNATLTVDVVDDVPTVQDTIVQVTQGTLPHANLVFVIDSSGSMAGEVKSVAADGTVTIMNRLQATQVAVAAVINEYFSQGGNISVTLIDFDATASDRGTYTTAASAIAALNNAANFAVGGNTNYEAALTQVITSMGAVNTLENNTVYFISDGVPSAGDITDPAANGYRNFITTNGIKSYAIGIASDIANPTELNNIHNVDSDNSGVKDAAIIVTNVATLDDVLLASVPTSFGGSVAGSTASSSLNFGADGGYISSLIMRLDTNGDNISDTDVTFNYNLGTNEITVVGGFPATGFPLAGSSLTLNAAKGFADGILIFNFATGEYVYQTAGLAAEGEQFDIKFVATDGDGDTANGKQTIQIVDGKPDANNDVDTLLGNSTFFEGNVVSGIGTDGGDNVQLTSFSTGRSGEDNPGDNGSVSSIVFKGVTFDLTTVVGSTAALGGTYTVSTIAGVKTLTWTASLGGSSLVFNEDGYYKYTPPTAEISTNLTGASTSYTLTSAALVTTAATAGMTLTGIARTSAAEGSAAVGTPNADGVGIVGNISNTQIDSLESLVITFSSSLHPHGVQGVTITVDASNSNLDTTLSDQNQAFNYSIYNVHGELIGQFASNQEGVITIPAVYTGIGKIVIDSGSADAAYSDGRGSISAVTYSTILDTVGTAAPAPEVIAYTITDADGDTSSATLTLNNIIDDIAGTAANNTINGTARNESISGLAGDDTINAGAGYDIVRGGDGNDTIDGGADDDQLYGNAGNDTISGGTGKDKVYGDAGNDTLSGNDGDDYLDGGAGNDIISGGLGADVILGGAGNDTLTGGGGVDTFRWELSDKGTTGAPATDVITDFDPAAVGGDVLDLRDLLTGEQHVSGAGNLASYLHFEVVGGNTIIHVSDNGAFSNGFSPAKDVQRITLTGVDLVQTFADDAAVIQNLLTNNKLIVD